MRMISSPQTPNTPPDLHTRSVALDLLPVIYPILRHAQFEDVRNRAFADPSGSSLRAIPPDAELHGRGEITIRPHRTSGVTLRVTRCDPKLQTPLAYTRLTAHAVRNALLAVPELAGRVPGRQTVGDILNRLGYRIRAVLKTRPEKKFPKPTRSSPTSTRSASRRQARRTR